MNKNEILNLGFALAFSLFVGIDSIIDFNLDYFVYNPIIILPLFLLIFYIIIKIETSVILKNRINKINFKGLIYGLLVFLILLTTLVFYIVVIDNEGLGNFTSYAEQGNFLFKLFRNGFLYLLLTFMVVGTFVSSLDKSKFTFNKLKDAFIINLTLFGLNYIFALVIIPIFNVIFLLIGFSTGG